MESFIRNIMKGVGDFQGVWNYPDRILRRGVFYMGEAFHGGISGKDKEFCTDGGLDLPGLLENSQKLHIKQVL